MRLVHDTLKNSFSTFPIHIICNDGNLMFYNDEEFPFQKDSRCIPYVVKLNYRPGILSLLEEQFIKDVESSTNERFQQLGLESNLKFNINKLSPKKTSHANCYFLSEWLGGLSIHVGDEMKAFIHLNACRPGSDLIIKIIQDTFGIAIFENVGKLIIDVLRQIKKNRIQTIHTSFYKKYSTFQIYA